MKKIRIILGLIYLDAALFCFGENNYTDTIKSIIKEEIENLKNKL